MNALGQRTLQAGLAGLYILCVSAFLSPAGVSVGSGMLALAFAVLLVQRRPQPDATTAAAIAAFFAFAIFRDLAAAVNWTGGPRPDWETLKDWLQLFLLVPFGVFLQGDPQRLGRLLLLALASLILGMFWRMDWNLALEAPQRLLTMRHGFGLTAIGFALLTGTALIGLVALRMRWWQSSMVIGNRAVRLLLWVLALAVLVQAFVQTESRGSWLALLLAAVFGLALSRWLMPRQRSSGIFNRAVIALAVVSVVSLVGLSWDRFTQRWYADRELPSALSSGELTDTSVSSLALRWHAQVAGIELWKEHPWIGWGSVSTRLLMEATNNPKLRGEEGQTLRHLHNTYLEILVQFGIIGLLLFAALVMQLIRGLWTAAKEDRVPADYAVFLLSAWAYGLTWAFFDFRAMHQDWRVHWVMLAGASLSWALSGGKGRQQGSYVSERSA